MVKYIIKGTEKEQPPTLELYLHEYDGVVSLRATDLKGFTWVLLDLRLDGTIRRSPDIPADRGLKVDERGRVVIS